MVYFSLHPYTYYLAFYVRKSCPFSLIYLFMQSFICITIGSKIFISSFGFLAKTSCWLVFQWHLPPASKSWSPISPTWRLSLPHFTLPVCSVISEVQWSKKKFNNLHFCFFLVLRVWVMLFPALYISKLDPEVYIMYFNIRCNIFECSIIQYSKP